MAGKTVGVDSATIRRWELGLFSPSSKRIVSAAHVYGVDVSTFIGVAESGVQNGSNERLSIKGYPEAGTTPLSQSNDLGTISLQSLMVQGGPDDFFLIISGDSLVPDGIHDGDALLKDPAPPPRTGGLCVAEKNDCLYAGTYLTPNHLRVRTSTGTTVELGLIDYRMVGAVCSHVRKL
jgi:SOS-response transcriptional repressor LexA